MKDVATPDATSFQHWLHTCADRIEEVLEQLMPADSTLPGCLHGAMRYAVLGGGKRVRAALVYAAGHACAGTSATPAVNQALDRAAAAVELIHAYSLVHDDLPCMDDDALRRSRPTVHIQYDEATAMLAGDALQPLAFACLADMPVAAEAIVQSVQTLACAIGSVGMVGGQAIDLASVGKPISVDALQTMHRMKTGALLAASVALGSIVASASAVQRRALDDYAQAIGLAFQVIDDILDVTADTASLGKTAGKDAADAKPTYVSLLGLAQARALAKDLRTTAQTALLPFGDNAIWLTGMADFIVTRRR